MKISVIIPTFNEEKGLGKTLLHLKGIHIDRAREIIVVDGGSSDETKKVAKEHGVTFVESPKKGRAKQMNVGAKQSDADILFFLHADSLPQKGYDIAIIQAVDEGYESGFLKLSFKRLHPLFFISTALSRLPWSGVKTGDHGFFITRTLFEKIGGYNEQKIIFEDIDIAMRTCSGASQKTIDSHIQTSTRKFEENGVIRLHFVFLLLIGIYHVGFKDSTLLNVYKKLITQNKI